MNKKEDNDNMADPNKELIKKENEAEFLGSYFGVFYRNFIEAFFNIKSPSEVMKENGKKLLIENLIGIGVTEIFRRLNILELYFNPLIEIECDKVETKVFNDMTDININVDDKKIKRSIIYNINSLMLDIIDIINVIDKKKAQKILKEFKKIKDEIKENKYEYNNRIINSNYFL